MVQTTILYALKIFAHQPFCVCGKEGHPQIVTLNSKHNADVPNILQSPNTVAKCTIFAASSIMPCIVQI